MIVGPNEVYNVYNPSGLKLLTRLRLGFSHLHAHKFSHNFRDCLDELSICGNYEPFPPPMPIIFIRKTNPYGENP